jgi:hypothetical protein
VEAGRVGRRIDRARRGRQGERAHERGHAVLVGQHGLGCVEQPAPADAPRVERDLPRLAHEHRRHGPGQAADQRGVDEVARVPLEHRDEVARGEHDAVVAAASRVEHAAQGLDLAEQQRLLAAAGAEADDVQRRLEAHRLGAHGAVGRLDRLDLRARQVVEDQLDPLPARLFLRRLRDAPVPAGLALELQVVAVAQRDVERVDGRGVEAGIEQARDRARRRDEVRAAGVEVEAGRERGEHEQREQARAELLRHAQRLRAHQVSSPSTTPPSGMSAST